MTEKQRRFVDEYVKTGNASKAARLAGYAAESSNVTASKLLTNANISREIQKRLEELHNERTAELIEVLEFLTAVMRGETNEQIALSVGTGKYSKVETVEVPAKVRDRLKAAELLAKIYGAFREKETESDVPTVIKIIGASELAD